MTSSSTMRTVTTSGRTASLITRTPLLDSGDVETKRQEILDYFHDSFTLYESLFDCLASDEAFYKRANRLRQPLIFYYGHTSVFYLNKLNVANLIDHGRSSSRRLVCSGKKPKCGRSRRSVADASGWLVCRMLRQTPSSQTGSRKV